MRPLAVGFLSGLTLTFGLSPSEGEAAAPFQPQQVNEHLVLDTSRFRPFEIEWERQDSDGENRITSIRIDLSDEGSVSLITARRETEIFDWSGAHPRKTEHVSFEVVARAADLAPVRTDVVSQIWNDTTAAWETRRWRQTFEPGRVIERFRFGSATSEQVFEVPAGVLQAEMADLAFGLHPSPPSELLVYFFDFAEEVVVERRYAIGERRRVGAAGDSLEVMEIRLTDSTEDEPIDRLYINELPWIDLGRIAAIKRLRVGGREETP